MKFVDLSALPMTWNKVGTIPNPIPGSSALGIPYTCIINGYFSVLYACGHGGNPSLTRGAVVYSFDGLGNMCTYQTSDFAPTPIGSITTYCRPFQIWQSNNILVYALLNGGTWKLTIPNIFTAGATYILPPNQLPTPSPCGGGTYSQTIFCGQQGLYCNEFIQDFPESDNYWASIYDQLGDFIGGGFIGNSPINLFDRRNISLPPEVFTSNIYDRNGLTVYANYGQSGFAQQVVGTEQNFLNGNPASLVCGSPSITVFVSGKNPSQIFYYRDYGMPGFSSNPDYTIAGTTDAFEFVLFPDISQGNVMLSNNFYIKLPTQYNQNLSGYLSKKKQLFNVNGDPFHYTGDVYMASLDLTAYGPPAIVGRSDFSGLANYHRAISPNGSFQA